MIQESPTLDLAKDCSRFVTRHFEIISTSSPHIYHSALALTPRESLIQKLYKSHARPLVKLVHGAPVVWDSNTATATFHFEIKLAVWSPCNRFVAICPDPTMSVAILDSKTLQRLQNLEFQREVPVSPSALVFSPDTRLLTSCIYNETLGGRSSVVSWDLQTGGVVSDIRREEPSYVQVRSCITYSTNGRMVAVLFRSKSSDTISIYDVAAGSYMHSVDNLNPTLKVPYLYTIWAHGESLRFATPSPMTITIWEVGFHPAATPRKIETFSIPDDTIPAAVFSPGESYETIPSKFHPAPYRIAYSLHKPSDAIMVWDFRASKFLLHHPTIDFYAPVAFSPDGRFFALTTDESEICLWEESSAGYILVEKVTPGTPYPTPRFSPNGESVITFGGSIIQLWRRQSLTTTSSNLTRLREDNGGFLLEFLPDRPWVVTARKGGKSVTVLDLNSGVPQFTIDTSIEVYGLRPIKNTIVVIGGEKVITWNLPGANLLSNARMNVGDGTQSRYAGKLVDFTTVESASVSSDLQYIALLRHRPLHQHTRLEVHCRSTGQELHQTVEASALWFFPGRHDIWCAADNEAKVFTIASDALNHTKTVADIKHGELGCPWGSSCGYTVTSDGWVLGVGGERLLMLPPLWRSSLEVDRVWNEGFLALLHCGLPEVVILDLKP